MLGSIAPAHVGPKRIGSGTRLSVVAGRFGGSSRPRRASPASRTRAHDGMARKWVQTPSETPLLLLKWCAFAIERNTIPDFHGYIRHAELFGAECVLETAREDLTRGDLGELKAFIDSKERTHRFKDGHWQERRSTTPRACEQCGLDLPRAARANMRFHGHCADSAYRNRAKTARAGVSVAK